MDNFQDNSNLYLFDASKKRGNNSGEPPRGNDLERRVEVLEKGFSRIEDALARIEKNTIRTDERLNSIETHFATKAELNELKSDFKEDFGALRTETNSKIDQLTIKINQMESSIIKWFVGTAIAICITASSLTFTVVKVFSPTKQAHTEQTNKAK